ncbi:glycosyl transferase, partial [Parasitella parasitica]
MSLFVTVGSTGFDELIRQTTLPEFLNSLPKVGIKKVLYQYGSSEQVITTNLQSYDGEILHIHSYKYKTSIIEDMEKADIIVSHAGAGTILQALRMHNKKLIVVVNKSLMDNHQYQLAQAMQTNNYAICSDLR